MKRPAVPRSHSSYFLQPRLAKDKELLASPFPPHVHRFLFSGRVIRLCDKSGAAIERMVDIGLPVKRQLDAITGKLDRKPPINKLQIKRKSLSTTPTDPAHPYHLTESICNTLKKYAEKVRTVEEIKDESVESDCETQEFLAAPKPSERLMHFLQVITERERKNLPRHKIIRCFSMGSFSLPYRGSHPGIWTPSTPASGLSSPAPCRGMPGTARASPELGVRIPFKRAKGLGSRGKLVSMFA